MSTEPEVPFEASFVPATRLVSTSDVERLTEAENGFLRAAHDQLKQAEAVKEFVITQLAKKYNLIAGDEISPDGTIERKGVENGA